MKNLQYDYSFMLKDSVGKNGVGLGDLKKLGAKLERFNRQLKKDHAAPYMDFDRMLDDSKGILAIKYTANRLKKTFDNLVVIGIGGSDLGTRAIIEAIKSRYHNENHEKRGDAMRIYFCGDTTDPRPLMELVETIDLSRTAFHVVSKSGGTIETMSAFLYLREELIKKVGQSRHHYHIVVTTLPDSGLLIDYVKENGYTLLPHRVVGGRFSALSAVSLLTAACADVEIDQLIKGAGQMKSLKKANGWTKNPAFIFAALNYLSYKRNKKNVTVLMPYEYKLKELGVWFRQLWAESLGKDGLGSTPVAALGPTDQHSQLQLYQDGPADKIITFIIAEKHQELKVPEVENCEIKYFSGKKFSQVLQAELDATALALQNNKRPNGLLIISELNEFYLGQLIYFFELAVVYAGWLYEINAFDQPGVELSKKYLHASLGNPKLKEVREDLEEQKKKLKKRYVA